jgi:signal transduction histidine kinase
MKELTHPGSDAAVAVDVNHVIATAVRMTRSEVRYVAETELELDELPPVRGRPGELGKVMVNLIVNARDAIAEAARGAPGVIRIRSRVVDGAVRIEVEDDGVGIADAARARVFDPFFTTKPVGIGTGQGLSLSRRIVEQQYGGRIAIASERGRGTTITIDLPVTDEDAE